jgi:AcrR family transcriptional regulator
LIVYRHFESKSELYAAILEQVTDRLVEEWQANTDAEHARGAAVPTLLTVARELPDGFRLLFVHAIREQEFAGYAERVRLLQLAVAEHLLGDLLPRAAYREWVVRVMVDHIVTAVLEWLDVGDPTRDAWWVEKASAGLRAAVVEWVS